MNDDIEASELGENLTFGPVQPIILIGKEYNFLYASQQIYFLQRKCSEFINQMHHEHMLV